MLRVIQKRRTIYFFFFFVEIEHFILLSHHKNGTILEVKITKFIKLLLCVV